MPHGAAKINALKFAKATGDMPENINFAITPGALRDDQRHGRPRPSSQSIARQSAP